MKKRMNEKAIKKKWRGEYAQSTLLAFMDGETPYNVQFNT
jgi:hypothetical protein